MLFAQVEQEHYANLSWISSLFYLLEDKVWLNAKNIYQTWPSQKLDAKILDLLRFAIPFL